MKKAITLSILTLLATGCDADIELTDTQIFMRTYHCEYTGDVLGNFPERTEHYLKGLGYNPETNTCKGYEDVSWKNYMQRYCKNSDLDYVDVGEADEHNMEGSCRL